MINFRKRNIVQDAMAEDYPKAVALAKEWIMKDKLKNFQQLEIEDVYNMLIAEWSLIKN